MKYSNNYYGKLDELPTIIQKFIKKLSKKIDKALEYTKDRNLLKTNNLVGALIKVMFPGKIKRICRTYAGSIMQINSIISNGLNAMYSKNQEKINLSVKFFTVTFYKFKLIIQKI